MKKNFITVAPHRRAFPKKRVFAGGGESSDSHLSEPSAPSPAGAGPHHPVLIVAIRAVPKKPEEESAEDKPKDRYADGGSVYDQLSPSAQAAARRLQYGYDPLESETQPVQAAQTAAPLPVPTVPAAPAPVTSPAPGSRGWGRVAPEMASAPGPSFRDMPTATPPVTAVAPVLATHTALPNSPNAPAPINWRKIAQDNLGKNSKNPLGGIAGMAGEALGMWARNKWGRKNPGGGASDAQQTVGGGEENLSRPAGSGSASAAASDSTASLPSMGAALPGNGMLKTGLSRTGDNLFSRDGGQTWLDANTQRPVSGPVYSQTDIGGARDADTEEQATGGVVGLAQGGNVNRNNWNDRARAVPQGTLAAPTSSAFNPTTPGPPPQMNGVAAGVQTPRAPVGGFGPSSNPVGMTGDQLQQMANQAAAQGRGTAGQNLGMMGLGINPFTGQSAAPTSTPEQAAAARMRAWGSDPMASGFGGAGTPGGMAPGGPPPGGGAMGPMMPPGGQSFGGPPGGGPPGGGMNPQLAQQLAAMRAMQGGGAPGGMGGPPMGGPPMGPPPGGGAMGPMMPPGGPSFGAPPPGGGAMGPMMGGGAPGMGGLPPGVNPQQLAMMQALQQQQGMGRPPGFAKGGSVAVEDEEGDSPRAKKGKDREWGDVGKAAEDLPPVEAKAKGGKVKKHAPFGKGAPPKKKPTPPVPMVTDEDMDAPPPVQAAPPPVAPPAAGPAGPPPGPPPPGMNKGGKCDMGDKMMAKGGGVEQKGKTDCENVKMAAGGVAKVRHGFPNTNKKPKRMAKGGTVRGCGAAQKGKGFSGVY